MKYLKTAIILVLATLMAIALSEFQLRSESILMIYVVAVLIIITETDRLFLGMSASVVCVLIFNYLFTEPRYTFSITDPNYYVSIAIFLIVAWIVGTLTARLKKQIGISKKNEERTQNIYKIIGGYLNLSGEKQILLYGEKSIRDLVGKMCYIYIKREGRSFEGDALNWCYNNSMVCGFGENKFADLDVKYLPVRSGHKTLGVVELEMESKDLDDEQLVYVNTVVTETAMALERESLSRGEEDNKFKIETEKIKSNLLRSVSHDLRTPLTSIEGSAGFLLDSLASLDKETVESLLSDINREAKWMNNLVENLLNMTRIQEGKTLIEKKGELADDIIAEAISRIGKRLDGHKLKTLIPDAIVLIPMDGQLIIQALVNLIDNAVKHTRKNCEIALSVYLHKDCAIFEVSDDGGGLPENFQSKGLGLSIVKTIVEAHGGELAQENNKNGGATFKFALPLEENNDDK